MTPSLPPPAAPSVGGRRPSLVAHLALAAMAYVPLLRTAPGRVAADTKVYLFLDPGRLLSRATSMWDPNVGFGTVTHQNIGYLWPMGPWFWVFDRVGAPDWVAQRLWVATFLFAAGAGVLFLGRTTGGRAADPVAGFAAAAVYVLTPYVLQYGTRTSVLLLPWAGLPWLIGLAERALRTGGWRHPATFALVVATIGSVNATALLLAGVGPLLWIAFAVGVHRTATVRRALATTVRIGLLTSACSLWWVAGLVVQGRFGVNVLEYSETVSTVAATSLASEVVRGLGYWFFYGGDKTGPWNRHVLAYAGDVWLLTASFAAPGLALVATTLFRWRHRAFFVALTVVGVAASVGAYPYDDPSPLGALVKGFATSSTAGLAMRSTPRAVPLVVLGLAVLTGGAVHALLGRSRRRAVLAGGLVVVTAAVAIAPLWTGDLLDPALLRDEAVPAYWEEAAAHLDGRRDRTRAVEVPGIDFASYRWGQTLDPITPGLMDRPYAARELIPLGSPATADLLNAFDRRFQEGLVDPEALAPVLRRMAAGDLVLRSDLQFERYLTPRPRATWALFDPRPPGLGAPVAFGPREPNRPIERLPLLDVLDLATPANRPDPPPVAVFPVAAASPIAGAAPAHRPVLLAGDGEGMVEAAAAGVLDRTTAPIVYSASASRDAELRRRLLGEGAALVVTDSNRRRARHWNRLTETFGFTEPAGYAPLLDDPFDHRLPVFPEAGDDAFTTVVQRGVAQVAATSYGNPVTYTPEHRPANALDGDLGTAWRAGDFSPVEGERLVVRLTAPVTAASIEVVQPLTGPRNRSITRVALRLDDREAGSFDLDEASRTAGGQSLSFRRQTFSTLELEVQADSAGRVATHVGQSPVGFAEVRIPGVSVDEVVRLPRDLLAATGAASAGHDLHVLVERVRWNPLHTDRQDEERSLVRQVDLPTARSFAVAGEARLSAFAPGPVVDEVLGIPPASSGGLTVRTSSSLHGSLVDRGSSALDGDPTTAWRTRFREQEVIGAWIEADVPAPVTVARLDLVVVADGRHSVPTRLRVEGGGQARIVDVPLVPDVAAPGGTVPVALAFEALTTDRLRVTVERVRPATSIDYFEERAILRPLGIAELGIPGVVRPPASVDVLGACRSDLVSADGRPVPLRLAGTVASAVAREPLAVTTCDGSPLDLPAGARILRSSLGERTGIDVDALALHSVVASNEGRTPSVPEVVVTGSTRTSFDLEVDGADEPFWLVVRQSHNPGWRATVDGRGDLGAPVLVDGFANGWYVDPQRAAQLSVSLTWTPQRGVTAALWASLAAGLVCVWLALRGRRWWSDTAPPPVLTPPHRFGPGDRPAPRRAWLAAIACGVASGAVAAPVVGLAVLVAAGGAVALGRRGRGVLTGGAILAYAAAASLVLAEHVIGEAPRPDFTWPANFHTSHLLTWLSLLLLATDVVVGWTVRRAAPPG
ncbi:MAG TPA: alpha-(1-_3)-arabinofuranosyltransferase family protein [Acidimicrobiales bacterium]|nr:alpha-(1->3)-arabinofuranosyltransferase family protein [Acidimicrobiales bacterium]